MKGRSYRARGGGLHSNFRKVNGFKEANGSCKPLFGCKSLPGQRIFCHVAKEMLKIAEADIGSRDLVNIKQKSPDFRSGLLKCGN